MIVSATLAVLAILTGQPPASSPREVTLASEPTALAGTLIDAGPGAPAALIIAGSGPTDRDGNSPIGIVASTYRLLAEGLAAEGISTLRYDKRGVAASAPAALAESDLRFDTMVRDAGAWAGRLREETGQACVWLIGHSEGALIAQAVAAENQTGICGLVLLSGAGRPAAVVLREQLRATTPEPYLSQAITVIDELDAGRTVDCPPILAALCRASVQPYVISWFDMDPVALAAAQELPTLVLQGTTDIQTSVEDARMLAAARPGIELVLMEGVNHLLKVAPADRAANIATYSNPDLPLAGGVVDQVAGFIRQ
ncbi:MAG TPA: alpha/beta fold hydrolase [Brevundimonas sp.]|jgi:pimeloyl-ACP methyl ester carboxylesterase|uniref:alpha/beta hydrolase n=1 Tax=Brevundimonas sp. TaxID=1871086 RepID=UPI002BCD18FB|nr:alpha/beta fold hydrolase [Brevundimonas sp.]HRH19362.1 alpha/beta fold hydrolase [Brevundimonas sp.]